MKTGTLTIIAYDIKCNKRRRKIARIVDDFGCRVQLSLFYGWLTSRQRSTLEALVSNTIDPEEDSILILSACDRCADQLILMGRAHIEPLPEFWIFA